MATTNTNMASKAAAEISTANYVYILSEEQLSCGFFCAPARVISSTSSGDSNETINITVSIASSAMLICKEANGLSRIKEAVLNLQADDGESETRLEEDLSVSETIHSLEDECSVSKTTNYTEDSDAADSSHGLQDDISVTVTRGDRCWDVEYACRCFVRFATEQELEGHTCHEVAPELSQVHDDPTELELPPPNVQVGSRIAVYWACYDQYFEATVTRQNVGAKKPLFLAYDDGDCEWVNLREKTFRLLRGCSSSSSVEDGTLAVEYGCKHCPFMVYDTKEKLLDHESSCHAGVPRTKSRPTDGDCLFGFVTINESTAHNAP